MPPAPGTPIFTPRPPRSGNYLHSQYLQLRCAECRNLFEAETPVNCDVAQWGKAVSRITCPACRSGRVLMGQGRTREEDAAFPHGATEGERIALWLENGETGSSSMAIHQRLSGGAQESTDTPSDLADLNRCILLLARIPGWRERMGEMADVSDAWSRLGPAWEALTGSLYEEAGFWLDGPAPRTLEMLRSLNARPVAGAPPYPLAEVSACDR